MNAVRRWARWLAGGVVALGCSSSSNSPGSPDAGLLHVASPVWEEQVVYFVMTDRFANGDTSNDNQNRSEFDPTDGDKYSGGDLKGIIDRLDYIQGLGATAVWITPPVANMWWDPLQQSGGYHGYWARHLKKVDEHVGTLDTYKALSDALHRRGMYLIQDVVPNHMGNFFTYSPSYDPADVTKDLVMNTQAVPTAKPEQSPFDQDDPRDAAQKSAAIYHWTPVITDYFDANQEVNYQVSDLDDLNSENATVRTALRDSYGYWIKEVGVDAFRVDTVKYVPHDFWNDFFWSTASDAPGMMAVAKATGRNRFFAFGEVFENSDPMSDTADTKVASYLGSSSTPELPALLGYPLYSEINRVFTGGQPTSYLTYRLGRFMDPALYPNPYATPTFIDNHDNQRFLAVGSRKAMIQALALIFTIPGIPVVYYGTEQDFFETRAAMFAGGWRSNGIDWYLQGDRYLYLKRLADIRKANKAFTQGTLEVLYENQASPGVFAYRRAMGSDTFFVIMNTSDGNTLMSGLHTGLPAGTQLKVLDAEGFTPAVPAGSLISVGDGNMVGILPGRSVQILQATTQQTTVTPPAATINVNTPIDGQTFSDDVTVTGSVTPIGTALKMVIDGAYDRAADVTVKSDGTFSILLPVSAFPIGTANHTLAFYAPAAQVSTARLTFTSNIVFVGNSVTQDDPAGDDRGRSGTYSYPQDLTFQGKHYGDVVKVMAEVGRTTMLLHVTLADWSVVWKPALGFDHVAFNIFFSIPAQQGLSALPKLNASMPTGLTWNLDQFTYGWNNAMYTTNGATSSAYGTTTIPPVVQANQATKTVTFSYNRTNYGLSTWEGVKVYVTTWDFDGIGGNFRPLSPAGGQWDFGGGQTTDPLIMDEVLPITLPAPP